MTWPRHDRRGPAFIGDLVWNDRTMDAFTANYGFVNSNLAAIYRCRWRTNTSRRVSVRTGTDGLLGQGLS
jgi:hypothetical protein